MRNRRKLVFPVVLAVMAFLATGPSLGWAQYPGTEISEGGEPAKTEEAAKVPLPVSPETPGYFPKGTAPAPVSSLELSSITTALGPSTGVMAPYGNPAAYDTLIRGWKTHKVGPFNVSTFLQPNVGYRGNVFSTSTNQQSDWVIGINPGIRVELPVAQRHKISLGYLGNSFNFTRFGSQSHLVSMRMNSTCYQALPTLLQRKDCEHGD